MLAVLLGIEHIQNTHRIPNKSKWALIFICLFFFSFPQNNKNKMPREGNEKFVGREKTIAQSVWRIAQFTDSNIKWDVIGVRLDCVLATQNLNKRKLDTRVCKIQDNTERTEGVIDDASARKVSNVLENNERYSWLRIKDEMCNCICM